MNAVQESRYKRPESVLVLVHSGDQVLVLKRADHPNFWQSVTGALEWEETPHAAAVRELAEETGIQESDGLRDWERSNRFQILPQWRHRYAPGVEENLEHVFSLALPNQPVIQLDPREHSEYRWLGRVQAAATVWSWSNREAILELPEEP